MLKIIFFALIFGVAMVTLPDNKTNTIKSFVSIQTFYSYSDLYRIVQYIRLECDEAVSFDGVRVPAIDTRALLPDDPQSTG